ncbi:riboflavin aldehyde-forming enzyme [Coccidioides immitis RMSCC 3703]|nr:riboflavin aldehyde-forming enzyme [Coccidioides immitis RMSCC 3703]
MAMLKEEVRFGGNKKKQRLFFCGIAAALVLLVLIIGLAVGLSKKKKSSNLPLPLDNGGPYSGDLTYYEPGLGACGITSAASENVCAVSRILYDAASTGSDPNQNPLCGLKLRLRRGDKSVDVTVVDRCVACEPTDIDVSVSVFEKLALVEQGRVDVEWAWLEKAPVKVPHD